MAQGCGTTVGIRPIGTPSFCSRAVCRDITSATTAIFLYSSEVALTTLELCDVLQQSSPRVFLLENATMRSLQQVGLDVCMREVWSFAGFAGMGA